MSITFEILTVT